MKKNAYSIFALAGLAMAFGAGCNKAEPAATEPVTPEPPKAAQPAAPATPAAPAVPAAPSTATPAVTKTNESLVNTLGLRTNGATLLSNVTEIVKSLPSALLSTNSGTNASLLAATQTRLASVSTLTASNQVQSVQNVVTNQVDLLIAQGKSLLAEKKYQEAWVLAGQIYTNYLTPEQRQIVDGLKAQLQTSMKQQVGTNAVSIIGNLLGGKK